MTRIPVEASEHKKEAHVLLMSAPWPLFNRPSIQLGALKAFLRREMPRLDVTALHFFLLLAKNLGYDIYKAISQRTWLAETIYAALLFPEKKNDAQRLFRREARSNSLLRKVQFDDLLQTAARVTDDFVAALPDRKPLLAGFTISFCQLTATLYLIKKIRARFPGTPVVVGGASVAGLAGCDLPRLFGIDYVVQGEGELPLLRLVKALVNGARPDDLPPIPGIRGAGEPGCTEAKISACQMERLDPLPMPDYDDYFEMLNRFGSHQRFFAVLPLEASRGCWWQPKVSEKGLAGCAFCNLNLQWQGYRSKSAQAISDQVVRLVQRYRLLSLTFTDNVLPPHVCRSLFTRIAQLGLDLRLFAEIRAITPEATIRQMKAAGMEELQIGIEALSTSLLRRMNKGTRAIDNIQAMKACEAAGIVNASNLLIRFPGSTAEQVDETLKALDFVLPFRPLRPVRFWLGMESPVWRQPDAFGISAPFNHPNYRLLFPEALFSQMTLTIQGYRGDAGAQRALWQPVVRKMGAWRRAYDKMTRQAPQEPLLYYRDGKTFLIIVQHRPNAAPLKHRLTGHSRDIYLFCGRHRSFERISKKFSFLSPDNLRAFLDTMVSKRLMFTEEDRYLSLAVPLRG